MIHVYDRLFIFCFSDAREEMLTQGFTNWSKRDFNAFIKVRLLCCDSDPYLKIGE